MNDDLTDFVRRGLASGHSRLELEQALLKASWAREQVRSALDAFADVDFPIPRSAAASRAIRRSARRESGNN